MVMKLSEMAKNQRQHRKTIEVLKHFMAVLRTLLIALTIHVRIMCIWFCPLQIFAID